MHSQEPAQLFFGLTVSTGRRRRGLDIGRQLVRLLLAVALLAATLPVSGVSYEIEINKARRLLVVRAGEEVLRVFKVSTGRGGVGDKQRTSNKALFRMA